MRVDYFKDRCPSAALMWPASRLLNSVHWDWDAEQRCYTTFKYTRDARIVDLKAWEATNPLSSLLRAVREDARLDDPLIRLIAFYITAEYLATVKV